MNSPQSAIDMLNEAFKKDPEALHALLCNRVPCNKALGADAHIITNPNTALEGDRIVVGALGLINGVLSALGYSPIALAYEEVNEQPGKLRGFTEWKPPIK